MYCWPATRSWRSSEIRLSRISTIGSCSSQPRVLELRTRVVLLSGTDHEVPRCPYTDLQYLNTSHALARRPGVAKRDSSDDGSLADPKGVVSSPSATVHRRSDPTDPRRRRACGSVRAGIGLRPDQPTALRQLHHALLAVGRKTAGSGSKVDRGGHERSLAITRW